MKRIVSLVLTLCLLLAAVVPVSALEFSDAEQVMNLNAVTTLVNLGLFNGYADGTFQPKVMLRRSEAAKVLHSVSMQEAVPASQLQFSDVPAGHWALSYVTYCVQTGILSAENGAFRPDDCLTGVEFAAAVLKALGRGGEDAESLGLFRDYTVERDKYVSRDGSCLILYNAMQAYAVVERDADGTPVYAVDDLMNPQTYLEYRFRVVKFSGVLEANEYGSLAETGGHLEKGNSKLKGHMAFQVSTPMEFLGRTVEFYTVRIQQDGVVEYRVVGIPALASAEEAFTVTSVEYFDDIVRQAGLKIGTATEIYFNADMLQSNFRDLLGTDYTITAVDYNRDLLLDKILVTNYNTATVVFEEPLRIRMGAQEHEAVNLRGDLTPMVGAQVRVVQMAGAFYICG